MDQDKWFTMSEKSQKCRMAKVYSEALDSVSKETHHEYGSNSSDSNSASTSKLIVTYWELVNSYRIATSTLEDIWNKAAHLVTTCGLVTSVPGQTGSGNRMVASVNGGEPHYVIGKSSGQYICNGLCPQFTAYKICQHVVAAAEDGAKLSSFCTWWKSQHKGPNVDSLAMSGLPKGVAGQKGGVAKHGRRGRRKDTNTSTLVTTTDRISTCTPVASATPTSTNAVSDTSAFGDGSGQESQFNSHFYYSYPPVPLPSLQESPSSFAPHIQSLRMQGSPLYSCPPHGLYGSPYQSIASPSSSSYSPHGIQPYYLKMLTKQIRVCSGCRFGYDNEVCVPAAPYNMCISHQESYQVSPRSQQVSRFTTKTVVHYHANLDCIWKKNPNFIPTSLKIPSEVMSKLVEANKTYLIKFFGIAFD